MCGMPRTRTLNFLACALIAGCTAAVPIGVPTPLITAFTVWRGSAPIRIR